MLLAGLAAGLSWLTRAGCEALVWIGVAVFPSASPPNQAFGNLKKFDGHGRRHAASRSPAHSIAHHHGVGGALCVRPAIDIALCLVCAGHFGGSQNERSKFRLQ